MIKKALIIAAGNGSRLKTETDDTPKPLRKVAGVPLLNRVIHLAKKAGITEFVIVVGHQKEKIIKELTDSKLPVKITFVENPDWQKSNGVSVLKAKDELKENFVLLMSDHLFDFKTLEKFSKANLGDNRALLAVDYRIKDVFDLDDATKVEEVGGKIKTIGKTISSYNCIDTGMFLMTPEIFTLLDETYKIKGDTSLSDGIQALSARNQMGTWDIQGAFWQDVDTPEMFKHAEDHLFNACRKSTDGVISRNFNRHVSLFFTRFLVKTPITANMMTFVTFVVGVLSGYFVSQGTYLSGFLGAFLFKLSSILDGCDGELSKLKYTESKMGQWLDTAGDNLTYIIFIIGVVIGVNRMNDPYVHITGPMTLIGLFITMAIMFFYIIKKTDSGSLLAIQNDFNANKNSSLFAKIISKVQFMIKRDFFTLVFFFMAAFNQLPLILWSMSIGSNIAWLVLLNSKLGIFSKTSKAVNQPA